MSEKNLVSKRIKARFLIVVKKMPQNKVAKLLGVSIVTMSIWNKKYKWKDQAEKAINMQVVFDEFKAYLRSCDSSLVEVVDRHWKGFLNSLENECKQE